MPLLVQKITYFLWNALFKGRICEILILPLADIPHWHGPPCLVMKRPLSFYYLLDMTTKSWARCETLLRRLLSFLLIYDLYLAGLRKQHNSNDPRRPKTNDICVCGGVARLQRCFFTHGTALLWPLFWNLGLVKYTRKNCSSYCSPERKWGTCAGMFVRCFIFFHSHQLHIRCCATLALISIYLTTKGIHRFISEFIKSFTSLVAFAYGQKVQAHGVMCLWVIRSVFFPLDMTKTTDSPASDRKGLSVCC